MTLRAGGRDLELLWFGPPPGQATTLVFLHEGLGSASTWRDFPSQLAAATGCSALVYSRAGYGASDPVALPRSIRYMHDEAEVLRQVLEAARVGDAILVGHSDGASIALIHAGGGSDDRLRALLLESPHVFAEPMGLESTARMRLQYETTDLRQRLMRHHGANVDVAFRGWNDAWLHPEFRDWNIEEFLPSIGLPTLLLQGAEDEYGTWKQIEAIETAVRGPVQSILIPDCGHAPHRDQPALVLAAMAAFVRQWITDPRQSAMAEKPL